MLTIALLAALGHHDELAMHTRHRQHRRHGGGCPRGAAACRRLCRGAGRQRRLCHRQAGLRRKGGTEVSFQPRDWRIHPPHLFEGYRSTVLRAPSQKLIRCPECCRSIRGRPSPQRPPRPARADLTRNGRVNGEPLGERIIVTGQVLDEDARPVAGTLVELWQANAAGRYIHKVRPARRAAGPELPGRRPLRHRRRGPLPLPDDQSPAPTPGATTPNCLAAAAHPFLGVPARPSPQGW